jgi:hypothetical protein
MGTWAGICDNAMRRAARSLGMAAVACVYGVGFGDRRVFSLASGDARTRVGGSWRSSSLAQHRWSKAKSALDTASDVSAWWLHDAPDVRDSAAAPRRAPRSY